MLMPLAACNREDPDATSEVTATTTPPKLSLIGMVDETQFSGKDYNLTNDRYVDAKEIIFTAFMQPIVKEYKWTYSYVAKIGDKEIDRKDNIESSGRADFEISIKSDEPFEEGRLVIIVSDEDGNEICRGETDVRQTPPPSIATFDGFTMEVGKTCTLPGTDISVTVSDRFKADEPKDDSSVKQEVVGFFNNTKGEVFEIVYSGEASYKSHVVDSGVENGIIAVINYFQQNHVMSSDPKSYRFKLGDDDFIAYYTYSDPIPANGNTRIMPVGFAIGDHDSAYTIVAQIIFPGDEEINAEARIDELLKMFAKVK